jgi:acetylornithine/succinyldiaminopimelate/putrescine aminotransferase
MYGVEFYGPAAPVVAGLRARGILATKAGDNVLRLLPPLVVKRSDLQSFLLAFDSVLATGAGRAFQGSGGAVA